MTRTILLALVLTTLANAGVIRFVTYPVRHPIAMVKKTGHVVKVVVW